MLDWLLGRRKADRAPAVKEAIETRDALFNEAQDAMEEVDKVQRRVIEEYERANHVRKRK